MPTRNTSTTPRNLEFEAELSKLQWTLEHLQSANADVETALDCFTTPQEGEEERFELAAEMEIFFAVLDGNLSLAIDERLGQEELSYLRDVSQSAAELLDRFAARTRDTFDHSELSDLLTALAGSYRHANEQLTHLLELSPDNNWQEH